MTITTIPSALLLTGGGETQSCDTHDQSCDSHFPPPQIQILGSFEGIVTVTWPSPQLCSSLGVVRHSHVTHEQSLDHHTRNQFLGQERVK